MKAERKGHRVGLVTAGFGFLMGWMGPVGEEGLGDTQGPKGFPTVLSPGWARLPQLLSPVALPGPSLLSRVPARDP